VPDLQLSPSVTGPVTVPSGWVLVGAASPVNALADEPISDASYLEWTAGGLAPSILPTLYVEDLLASLGPGTKLTAINFGGTRWRVNTSVTTQRYARIEVTDAPNGTSVTTLSLNSGPQHVETPDTWRDLNFAAAEPSWWTGTGRTLSLYSATSGMDLRAVGVKVRVRADLPPTVEDVGPTAVNTDELELTWGYADDYRAQAGWEAYLVRGDDGPDGLVGLTPPPSQPGNTLVAWSGERTGTDNRWTVDTLEVDTYTAYVRVRQQSPSASHWSQWRRWKVDVNPPLPPTLPAFDVSYSAVGGDPAAWGTFVTDDSGPGPATLWDLERWEGPERGWVSVHRERPIPDGRVSGFVDRTADTVGARWRARSVYYNAVGERAASAWVEVERSMELGFRSVIAVGVDEVDGTPADQVAGGYIRVGDAGLERTVPAGVFRPLVGGLPYVTSGEPGGLDGVLEVGARNAAEVARWVELWRNSTRWAVRLVDVHRPARWVAFAGTSPEDELLPGEDASVLTLPYYEVAPPDPALRVYDGLYPSGSLPPLTYLYPAGE
jgi:hypothetical protein